MSQILSTAILRRFLWSNFHQYHMQACNNEDGNDDDATETEGKRLARIGRLVVAI